MNIVFLDTATVGNLPALEKLHALGKVTFHPTTTREETAERIREAGIVITNKVVLDRQMLDQAPALKLICVTATGTNNIDMEYARSKGIEVRNATGYSTASVAQATFGFIFYFLNHIPDYHEYVQSGAYSQRGLFTHLGREIKQLESKQLGIIGLGNIGQRVAAIAQCFGAKVSYYSSTGQDRTSLYPRKALKELLTESDIVSIHAPLNERTKNLINLEALRSMPKHAYLLNLGRGGIVNEADLAVALDEGWIAGAALDVYAQEPLPWDSPLLQLQHKERLLLAPHVAWSAVESRELLLDMTLENIKNFLNIH